MNPTLVIIECPFLVTATDARLRHDSNEAIKLERAVQSRRLSPVARLASRATAPWRD